METKIKLITTLALIGLLITNSYCQDTIYYDLTNQVTVNKINANNPSLYTQDSSRVDTLYTYNSGIQNMRAALTTYSETIPSVFSNYRVSFIMTYMAGGFNYNIDTNSTSYLSGLFTNIPPKDSLVLKSSDIIEFNISNTTNAGRYQVVIDIVHTVDTFFVTNLTTYLKKEYDRNEIILYPNPFVDFINIDGLENENYRIFNSKGQLVKGGIIRGRIDLSELEKGMYYLLINEKLLSKTITKI